ncbi:hypothetical protein [Streptomyces piniterrae]|uniref:hypothetical protein n=1 Tax=Streptomyces piniterrae TaxID=2571125 RepID=UPI00145E44AA|nr:hypothetical protein [Streptomyces piniterrae]
MTMHVHVRLIQSLTASEHGELVEFSSCRCGATWLNTYPAEGTGAGADTDADADTE